MNWWQQLIAGSIGAGLNFYFGWQICKLKYMIQINDLKAEIKRRDTPITAPKFRVRTAESDPNRQSKVRKARIRAIIYRRPDPRK